MSSTPEKPNGPATRDRGDWTRALREAAPYLGLGTSMAVTVLIGIGGGYWIDGRLGTSPIFLLAGAAFGLFAAFYSFSKAVKRPRP